MTTDVLDAGQVGTVAGRVLGVEVLPTSSTWASAGGSPHAVERGALADEHAAGGDWFAEYQGRVAADLSA